MSTHTQSQRLSRMTRHATIADVVREDIFYYSFTNCCNQSSNQGFCCRIFAKKRENNVGINGSTKGHNTCKHGRMP